MQSLVIRLEIHTQESDPFPSYRDFPLCNTIIAAEDHGAVKLLSASVFLKRHGSLLTRVGDLAMAPLAQSQGPKSRILSVHHC